MHTSQARPSRHPRRSRGRVDGVSIHLDHADHERGALRVGLARAPHGRQLGLRQSRRSNESGQRRWGGRHRSWQRRASSASRIAERRCDDHAGHDGERGVRPGDCVHIGQSNRGRTRAARALCDRETYCGRIGAGKAFESADACMASKRERVGRAVSEASCRRDPWRAGRSVPHRDPRCIVRRGGGAPAAAGRVHRGRTLQVRSRS